MVAQCTMDGGRVRGRHVRAVYPTPSEPLSSPNPLPRAEIPNSSRSPWPGYRGRSVSYRPLAVSEGAVREACGGCPARGVGGSCPIRARLGRSERGIQV